MQNTLDKLCLSSNSATASTGLIFIVSGYSFALIWDKQYFLFDPHSRDCNGLISVDGTSVLLKFKFLMILKNMFKKSTIQIQQEKQFYMMFNILKLR